MTATTRKRYKNRKHFIYIVQGRGPVPSARVYRLKKNVPEFAFSMNFDGPLPLNDQVRQVAREVYRRNLVSRRSLPVITGV